MYCTSIHYHKKKWIIPCASLERTCPVNEACSVCTYTNKNTVQTGDSTLSKKKKLVPKWHQRYSIRIPLHRYFPLSIADTGKNEVTDQRRKLSMSRSNIHDWITSAIHRNLSLRNGVIIRRWSFYNPSTDGVQHVPPCVLLCACHMLLGS